MPKPSLGVAALTEFASELVGERVALEPLTEGLESQAFRAGAFVLRVNPSTRGFEKDRWAHDVVGGRAPVPRVVDVGWIDAKHAYCLTEWVPGRTLEELGADAERLASAVVGTWERIAATDVSGITGFGDFDASGEAPAGTWREVLEATLRRDAPPELLARYAKLIDACPEERGLIHGDFGSNNVLANGAEITAVLDWENAMVGDPLYDVANVHFWATYLECMRVLAPLMPSLDERVLCYALRIGIEETSEAADTGDERLAAWSTARCRELIAATA